ncbi:MAG TPA: nitroreductase family protein [Methylophilaceae bacterium]|nr:nitroreductase family protein [Methylophilaceae bacterium]
MKVSEAVFARRSIRDFLKTPVSNSLIAELLEKSSRSPSGGNLQPWRIYVLNNQSLNNFLSFQERWVASEDPAYEIYPKNLKEPYRTSRYQLGEEMYSLLGIPREDKEARINQVLKNFNFFGAPVGIFCFIDKTMGPPQWSDLGMFLQTFMLLSQEYGLDTCAQEAWSMKQDSIKNFLRVDNELMLFCGVALGFKDTASKINQLQSTRRPLDEWATFV